MELSESVASALTQVQIVPDKVEWVPKLAAHRLQELVQKPADHQPELLAHLEQKLALPAHRFLADL